MSKTFNISLLPGDGTGPEVVNEAVKVLSKTSSYYDTQFNFSQNDLGGDRYLNTGDLVTDNEQSEPLKFPSEVSDENHNCPICNTGVEKGASTCPVCGYSFK